ncbi:MAG: LPS export ABC transporter periplasmic protein LptC [Elusimicrobia bacterium]|nr:LPS export ABC transporter periplasmic protein LptC [Elusimicrobiota bacterium]
MLAAGLLACAGCGGRRELPREERRQTMEGLTLSQSEKGRPSWRLESRLAVLREDERRATLTEPVMQFYRAGRAVSRVTALSGDINTETHDVRLSSAVVLDSFEDRSHLTTTDLLYSSARKRFVTKAEITVQRPEGVLRGRGLEATPDLSEIRIFDQRSVLSGTAR